MVRFLLKLGFFLLIGVVGYNLLFGNSQEKKQSRELLGKAAEVGRAGVSILADEYKKFRSGKYDDALENVEALLQEAKTKGEAALEQVQAWEAEHEKWKSKSESLQKQLESATDEEKQSLQEDLETIRAEAERLAEQGKALSSEFK